MLNTLSKLDWRVIFRCAAAGFAVTAVFVAYQVVANVVKPDGLNIPALSVFVVLCPPSLISIPVIDAETGTSAFYFLFAIIALLNSALYGAVGLSAKRLIERSKAN
ncbi:MAG TPA: hypothetical protein VGD60_15810 [Candidatus Acidoferrales bacterium]